MIVGGIVNDERPYQSCQYVDIIDLDNEASDCQSSEYPLQAYDIQAGVVLNTPVFCGGRDENSGGDIFN